jgi:hypothetical protein
MQMFPHKNSRCQIVEARGFLEAREESSEDMSTRSEGHGWNLRTRTKSVDYSNSVAGARKSRTRTAVNRNILLPELSDSTDGVSDNERGPNNRRNRATNSTTYFDEGRAERPSFEHYLAENDDYLTAQGSAGGSSTSQRVVSGGAPSTSNHGASGRPIPSMLRARSVGFQSQLDGSYVPPSTSQAAHRTAQSTFEATRASPMTVLVQSSPNIQPEMFNSKTSNVLEWTKNFDRYTRALNINSNMSELFLLLLDEKARTLVTASVEHSIWYSDEALILLTRCGEATSHQGFQEGRKVQGGLPNGVHGPRAAR